MMAVGTHVNHYTFYKHQRCCKDGSSTLLYVLLIFSLKISLTGKPEFQPHPQGFFSISDNLGQRGITQHFVKLLVTCIPLT